MHELYQICRECGKDIELQYVPEVNKELRERQLCYSDNFWHGYWLIKDDPKTIRIHGHHYRMTGQGACGFSEIVRNGVFIKETGACMHQGEIPEHWRERLPDNAFQKE